MVFTLHKQCTVTVTSKTDYKQHGEQVSACLLLPADAWYSSPADLTVTYNLSSRPSLAIVSCSLINTVIHMYNV